MATFKRQIPNSVEFDAEKVKKRIGNQGKGELNAGLLISVILLDGIALREDKLHTLCGDNPLHFIIAWPGARVACSL